MPFPSSSGVRATKGCRCRTPLASSQSQRNASSSPPITTYSSAIQTEALRSQKYMTMKLLLFCRVARLTVKLPDPSDG